MNNHRPDARKQFREQNPAYSQLKPYFIFRCSLSDQANLAG